MREDKQYDVINNKMLKNDEFYELIKDVLNNEEFIKRKEYHHHENRSVYVHSIYVSYYSYKIAKFLHMDYTNTAIGGLLHDFYYNDWQDIEKKDYYLSGKFYSDHLEKVQENKSKNYAKQYLVKIPNGEIIKVTNLDKFAKENNLTSGTLHSTFKKNKPTKGFQVIKRL